MAHFRGWLQGMRGEASRLGSKDSGLEVHAASWQGAVRVQLWHEMSTGMDMCIVELVPHFGSGVSKVLYRGPASGTLEMIAEEAQ